MAITFEPELIQQHLKIDDMVVEEPTITQYLASAISICEGLCNRKFYGTDAELAAARSQAFLDMAAIPDELDTALDGVDDCDTRRAICDVYGSKRAGLKGIVNGIVVDETVRGAILKTLGSLYRNRQDVASGQGASAVVIPMDAARILQPYLWIGDLA